MSSSNSSSPIVPLMLAALTAIGVAVGINRLGSEATVAPPTVAEPPPRPKWSATAPGRVEPKGGETRIAALTAGRIENVLIKANDRVRANDLLVRLDDTDAIARVMGADAEAGVRKRERDGETNVPRLTQERRTAEDRLNTTERTITQARLDLDRMLLARHADPANATLDEIAAQRRVLDEALKRLESDRKSYRESQLAAGVPLPTRLEAGLTASRAELSLAEAALERTRIRAPFDTTVLQVNAHVGETAVASPEQTMVVLGDLSALRVKAEVEERDVSKVTLGQEVVLKSDGFAGREFTGRVTAIAQAMRPPKLANRGPRRPSDLDTLEVTIDVDPGSPLLPGMRVDVFFKLLATSGEPGKTASSLSGPDARDAATAKAAPLAAGTGSAAPADAAPASSSSSASGAPRVLPPLADPQPKSN